jgi:hypothetical protein
VRAVRQAGERVVERGVLVLARLGAGDLERGLELIEQARVVVQRDLAADWEW